MKKNDITTLRNQLYETLSDLKNGDVKPSVAAEINNAAGKIIQTMQMQIAYGVYSGKQFVIDELETQTEQKQIPE